jgi:hypothetical protein
MMSVEPVDDTLVMYSQLTTYRSEAHPFQAQLQGLFSQGSIIPVGLRVGCEVSVAAFTSHALAAASVVAGPLYFVCNVTVWARWFLHNA